MFLAVIFGFRNKIYCLDSFIYGYVRSYAIGVDYVRSYIITEGACPLSVTHLAKNGPYISLSVRPGKYGLIRRDTFAK